MNERAVKAENQRLRREVAQLKKELEEARRNKPQEEYKIVPPAARAPAEKKYDPFNPCPNDPVFSALRAKHQQKRRSWNGYHLNESG